MKYKETVRQQATGDIHLHSVWKLQATAGSRQYKLTLIG